MKAATLTVLAMLSAVPMVGVAAQPAEGNSDHQQMLAKLKITSPLRPGPAGRLNADGTSSAQLRREQGHCRLAGATAAGDEGWPQETVALIDVNARRFGRAKLNRIWMDLEREVALCSMPLDRRV